MDGWVSSLAACGQAVKAMAQSLAFLHFADILSISFMIHAIHGVSMFPVIPRRS